MVACSCIFNHIHSYSFIPIHTHPHLFIFIHIHSYAFTFIHIHSHPFMFIHNGPVSPAYSVSWPKSFTSLFCVLCLRIDSFTYALAPCLEGRGVSLCFILHFDLGWRQFTYQYCVLCLMHLSFTFLIAFVYDCRDHVFAQTTWPLGATLFAQQRDP